MLGGELENIEGQVTINGGYTGTLEFKNLSQPLQVEGARNTELRVQAVPGRISMDLSQFTGSNIVGPVRLITGSRDIKLDQFTQSLELETHRGDIELMPGRMPMPSIEVRAARTVLSARRASAGVARSARLPFSMHSIQ